MKKYVGFISILIIAVTAYICFFIAKDLREAIGYSVIFIAYFVAVIIGLNTKGWRRSKAVVYLVGLTVVYIGVLALFTMSQR